MVRIFLLCISLFYKTEDQKDKALIYFARTCDIPVTDASATEFVPTGQSVDADIGM